MGHYTGVEALNKDLKKNHTFFNVRDPKNKGYVKNPNGYTFFDHADPENKKLNVMEDNYHPQMCYEVVEIAATLIKEELKESVTSARVRSFLGFGGPQAVTKYLKWWQEETGNAISTVNKRFTLKDGMETIWEMEQEGEIIGPTRLGQRMQGKDSKGNQNTYLMTFFVDAWHFHKRGYGLSNNTKMNQETFDVIMQELNKEGYEDWVTSAIKLEVAVAKAKKKKEFFVNKTASDWGIGGEGAETAALDINLLLMSWDKKLIGNAGKLDKAKKALASAINEAEIKKAKKDIKTAMDVPDTCEKKVGRLLDKFSKFGANTPEVKAKVFAKINDQLEACRKAIA